jgi:hypothetical protein
MYCSHCRRQLFYKNLENRGWCENCKRIVSVSKCKVSFWSIAAVFTLAWALPLGL